jgi:four helix bundle suffix protein
MSYELFVMAGLTRHLMFFDVLVYTRVLFFYKKVLSLSLKIILRNLNILRLLSILRSIFLTKTYKTMSKNKLVPTSKNYKKLYSFQKAEAIFDITYYFVHTYLRKGDRTIDQMQQAARSGKQNIAEGSMDAATSKEIELKLINVAKGSLMELYEDYLDYLRTRNHRIWEEDSIEQNKIREIARKHNDSAFYMKIVKTRPPETIANIAICLLKQVDYLLAKYIERLGNQFLKEGGFKERMTSMRINNRKQS